MHCCTDTSPMSVFIMNRMMMIIIILAQGGGYYQECSMARVLSLAPFGTRLLCERVRCQCLPSVFSSISNERFARLRYAAQYSRGSSTIVRWPNLMLGAAVDGRLGIAHSAKPSSGQVGRSAESAGQERRMHKHWSIQPMLQRKRAAL